MTAPNANALWGRTLVEELTAQGVDAVCVAPGSRSTPLTVAFAEHPAVRVFSHLDERSAAFFALGRAKVTGTPTPLVCTSGTAAAEFHPAVIEADRARVPMVLLTADRPPELRDSGANQTVDQEHLYGGAVRWYRSVPTPEANARTLRALRTTAARAVAESTGVPAGPVHLNFPFRKPLEPTEVPGEVPEDFAREHPRAARGRDGPYVRSVAGTPALGDAQLEAVADALQDASRGLIVAGPAPGPEPDALSALADSTGVPILADPLSGVRFGRHVDGAVCGGYDSYLDPGLTSDWPEPDVVVRFGASPTSKTLRRYLARVDARQFLVDPAGGWREASFTATDLVTADPTRLARGLAERVDREGSGWRDRFERVEAEYWELVADDLPPEGVAVAAAVEEAPDPATLFVSNSMPVRDLDRFARPTGKTLTTLGNRGASGIDGITSSALGAGSATDEPLVLVTGDVAYYHDMNGLLAVERCDVELTAIVINNDGGGIFHALPIEGHETFEQFKTPHGLDFAPTGDLYDLRFRRVDSVDALRDAYREALDQEGSHVIEVTTDAEESHRVREALHDRVVDALAE